MPSTTASQRSANTGSGYTSSIRCTGKDSQLTRIDLIWMAAGLLLCLLISIVVGHKRIFWEDEMLGWMLLRDPSFHHMVQAWNAGADGGGFSFYLIGRAWLSAFGASIVSFRMFSATCFGLAFCALWVSARRFYPLKAVFVTCFLCWFVSPAFVVHMAEGRFYGLLVLGTTLVTGLVMTRCQAEITGAVRTPPALYASLFLLNSLLTTSHLMGIAYSGVLLLALVFLDWRAGRFRSLLYGSGALSWLLLVPERLAIRASAAVGKPWFWTVPPDPLLFASAFSGFCTFLALFLICLLVLLRVSSSRSGGGLLHAMRQGYRERTPVYVVVAALFSVPVLFALEAIVGGTSLFTSRYLAPVIIATTLLSTELIRLIEWRLVLTGKFRMLVSSKRLPALVALSAICLLLWDFHIRRQGLGSPDYTAKLSLRIPRGVPVVCEDAWSFIDLISRQHSSGIPYTYLLDWAYSTSDEAPRLEVTQYHLMEIWKKVGYFSGSIRYRDEFLHNRDVFLVLRPKQFPRDPNGRVIGNPLLERFAFTPGFQVRLLSKGTNTSRKDYGIDQGYDIWLVCRSTCPK